MADFKEIVSEYKKKQSTTLLDSIAVGLSLADEVSVDLGILNDSGLLEEILSTVSIAVPFVVISVTEGSKVMLGRKTVTAALQDGSFRFAKSGLAMGAGAIAAGLGGGFLPAIPVAMGVRAMMDKIRSQALTGYRIEQRIKRLHALHTAATPIHQHSSQALTEGES